MNVDGMLASLQQGLMRTDRSLAIRGDDDFASMLTIGQILKGKVLRHIEGTRYSAVFGGTERVVDSSVPLRPGELLHGRIVALDEHVHLQRFVRVSGEATAQDALPDQGRDPIVSMLERYGVTLPARELAVLARMTRTERNPAILVRAAAILHKSGLPAEPILLRAVDRALQSDASRAPGYAQAGPALTGDGPDASTAALTQALAALLPRLAADRSRDVAAAALPAAADAPLTEAQLPLADTHSPRSDMADSDSHQQSEHALGHWLLNAQIDGSVAHRLIRFPIWFGDQLREVMLALFDQRPRGGTDGAVHYRKAVFALATGHLGRVEIHAHVADRRLRISIRTDSADGAGRLADGLRTLEGELSAAGWQVDELSYHHVPDLGTGTDEVSRAVAEHRLAPDSLSLLM